MRQRNRNNIYKMGDFVKWKMYDVKPSYAVVMDFDAESVSIRHFEGGFPFQLSRDQDPSRVAIAPKDEFIEHYSMVSGKFQKEIEEGGLNGAMTARKKQYLDGVIEKLSQEDSNPFYAAKIPPDAPHTGTYVLMGIYSGHGPSDHLEGLVVSPRLTESAASSLMKEMHPNGFGRIPDHVRSTAATSHGTLVGYRAFEVPKESLDLVENPRKLTLTFE